MGRPNIIARCHCGTIQFEIPRKPGVLTQCNCSYCRQIDPLFAYYKRRTIRFQPGKIRLEGYTWGRGVLQWFRCKRCGSFTHHLSAMTDPRLGWASTCVLSNQKSCVAQPSN